ncbi:oxidoreductase [Bradyrhizobium guangxiense]|uniref:oxidoreductase n=1 Tax=Bradyrhizobium guangxiense TaxID=1325115 RepID=UPI001008875E|nr:oxidoreductase [Bradyrhizobium guangxiense]
MRLLAIAAITLLGTVSFSMAQSSGGASGGSTSGGASATGSGGGGGSTLSNGTTLSGTGGSPGPNASNAKGQGTTRQRLGAMPSGQDDGGSRPNYNTPAANAAVQQLGNTNPGILKK